MHGRRRAKRSPAKSWIGDLWGKKRQKRVIDSEDKDPTSANAMTAKSEAMKGGEQNNHDTTHSHPAASFEQGEDGGDSKALEKERNTGPVGSWGQRTFGW
jgi:hypothetical protein